jgi:hypothetical protein
MYIVGLRPTIINLLLLSMSGTAAIIVSPPIRRREIKELSVVS